MSLGKAAFFVTAASVFLAAPAAAELSAVASSLLLVALGVALAWAASESISAIGAAAGAVGAFAGTILATGSVPIGAGVFVALAYGERTMRVASTGGKLLHVGGALASGALAGTVATSYLSATAAVRGVSVVVAAVLAALPLLIDADDPTAHALDALADDVPGPSGEELRRGAELRRSADDAVLARGRARQVKRTWLSLLKLGEARAKLHGKASTTAATAAVVEMLDQRIRAHVATLNRAYTAIDTAHAAELGLDDVALKSVDHVNESLDEVSRAMASDVDAELTAERAADST